MACVPLPKVPKPTLPGPLSITPTIPEVSFDPELCCKLLPFPVASPPIPLPAGVLNPGVNVILASNIKTVQAFLDALPLDCPKE